MLLPVAGFLVLRPESFGLTPNGLDPFFYTGYAINFDDILREVADRWYFVTRWSTYYPSYLLSEVFGGVAGRLVLRLLLASAMLLSLWHLGRRWRWSPQIELVVGVVTLTTPLFARAFLTDYNQFLVVSLGTVLVAQCLEARRTTSRTVAIGVLASLILVANPQTYSVVALPVALYTLSPWDRWTRAAARAVGIVLAGLATLAFGLVLFRAYGIPNVYSPTIDFIRTHASYHDPLKSPEPTWLYAFTWLYDPLILLALVVMAPTLRRAFTRDRLRLTILGLIAAQTAFQWGNQFILDRASLELSYYWSYIYPLFAIALAAVIALDRRLRWRDAAAFLGVWFLLLAVPTWTDFRLPGGWAFLVVAMSVVAVTIALARYSCRAWVVLVVFILLTQIAAPSYAPPATHPYNVDPHYDRVFFHDNSPSVRAFGEARWLAARLDSLPDDSNMSFIAMDEGQRIVAIYGAHVTGALIRPDPRTCALDTTTLGELRAGSRPRLAIYGPPDRVETCLRATSGVAARTLLDATNPEDLGFRLVVLEPVPVSFTIRWTATELPSLVGRLEQSSRVVSAALDAPGFVAFGPYVRLPRGDWEATLTYRSSASPGVDVGTFDVVTGAGTDSEGMLEIRGTRGELRKLTIAFHVDDPSLAWEFRTKWNGSGDLEVRGVSVGSRSSG